MSFNRTGAIDRALEVFKAGLESGAIKLNGSSVYGDDNEKNIRADTQYVNGLINSIADNLLELSKRG